MALDRVDFLRRLLRVDRQVWTPRNAPPVLVAPKSQRSYRTIALSDATVQALARHLERFEPGDESLLFHTGGRPWSRDRLGQVMRRTAAAAGLADVTWHSLRHHHASVLLSAGVSPALVAERLGHDVTTLLKVYAHVIRSDEDQVRALVDRSLGEAAEGWLRNAGRSG